MGVLEVLQATLSGTLSAMSAANQRSAHSNGSGVARASRATVVRRFFLFNAQVTP